MPDAPKEPSNAELLERLNQLETKNAELQAQIDDLREGQRIASMTASTEFALINILLYPVVYKVFPGYCDTQISVEKIIPPAVTDPRMDRKLDEKTK